MILINLLHSCLVKKNNYHHIRNVYLQYEMTKQKYVANAADRNPIDGDAFRLVKNCFA